MCGGTGIGLATAQLLARKGWHVTAIGLECADGFPRNARFVEESLIESEIPCGTGMCRPKYNNLAMMSVIDFEAR